MAIFTAIGIGLALPYVVFSFSPMLLEKLPAPGAWMESFKQAMAFPLWATVVWLLWVFTLQTSPADMAFLGFSLVFMSIAAWIYGRWCVISKTNDVRLRAAILVLICVLLSGGFAYNAVFHNNKIAQANSEALKWQVWSPTLESKLIEEERWILVDFTAAWCLTCQVNKHVFMDEEVIARLKELDVVLLKADWTNRDENITFRLAQFGRNGVPFNVIYPPGQDPIVLPALLTDQAVLDALM
jgi:thiol:disulfide interchange protein